MSSGGSNRLMTPDEVAEHLGVPKRSFLDNYHKWGIPTVRVGRAIRVRVRHLEQWIDSHTESVQA